MPAGPHSARRHREATCRDRSEGPRASACGCRGRGGGPECGSRVGPPASGGGSGVCPAWSGRGREAGRPPVSTRRAHAPVLFTLAMAPPSVPGSHLRLRPLFPIALHGPGAAAARPAGEQPERLAGERWRAQPRRPSSQSGAARGVAGLRLGGSHASVHRVPPPGPRSSLTQVPTAAVCTAPVTGPSVDFAVPALS